MFVKAPPVKLVFAVVLAYFALHCTLLSAYTLPKPPTATSVYLAMLQWLIPALFSVCYLFFPKMFNMVKFPVNLFSWLLMVGIVFFAVINLLGFRGLWFSWSTFSMICALLLVSLTINRSMSGIDALITSIFTVLFGLAIFEIIYQVGVLKFYDFFGADHRNFVLVMVEIACWIEPAIIIWYYMNKKYSLTFPVNRYNFICLLLAIVTGTIWFGTGFAIPVMWQGSTPMATNANETLIAVSRCTQVSVPLGIVFSVWAW